MRSLRQIIEAVTWLGILVFSLKVCFFTVNTIHHFAGRPGLWGFLLLPLSIVNILGMSALLGNSNQFSRRVADYFLPESKTQVRLSNR
jgi:hypothetical protein